jgi:hypothetical protein
METEREPSADERAGMNWWNSLPESERATWLAKAQSAKPSDAWAAFNRAKKASAQTSARFEQRRRFHENMANCLRHPIRERDAGAESHRLLAGNPSRLKASSHSHASQQRQ